MERMEALEMHDEEYEYVQYNKYDIILTVVYGSSINQIHLEVYFTPDEAYTAFNVLNKKIEELVRVNSPISLSLVCRNKEGEIIRHGVSGVVGIQHNVPKFMETLDEID